MTEFKKLLAAEFQEDLRDAMGNLVLAAMAFSPPTASSVCNLHDCAQILASVELSADLFIDPDFSRAYARAMPPVFRRLRAELLRPRYRFFRIVVAIKRVQAVLGRAKLIDDQWTHDITDRLISTSRGVF